MTAIGYVRSPLTSQSAKPREKARARIEVLAPFAGALATVKVGQSLHVFFSFDRSPGDFDLFQHPAGDSGRPVLGVFSIRSPRRPSPLGMTTVRVVAVKDDSLVVDGLDAWDGTPVVDLKS